MRFHFETYRGTPAQQRRPVAWQGWARPLGSSCAVLAYIAAVEGEPVYAAGLLVAAALLHLARLRWPAGPEYAADFPYVYVADLSEAERAELGAGRLTTGERALLAAGAAAVLLVAASWFTPGAGVPDVGVALGAFGGIWAHEIPARPERRMISISAMAGLFVAAPFAGFAMLFASAARVLTGTLAIALIVTVLVLIGFALLHPSARYPDRVRTGAGVDP